MLCTALAIGPAVAPSVLAQSPTAKARLDSAAMLLGDPNRVTVTVSGVGADARPEVDWSALDTMAELRTTGQPERGAAVGGGGVTVSLPFSVYDSVGLLLPALRVVVAGETLFTNDLALLVAFPPQDTAGVNPIRDIKAEPARWTDYLGWIVGAGIALLVALGAYVFARRRREGPAPAPVYVEPPHERALRELEALRQNEAQLEDKPFYSRLDRILRAYLEDRYDVPALESTSGQVVAMLRARHLPDEAELSALLTLVDLVKFARARVPAERRARDLDDVRDFVRATVPPPSEVERAGGALIIENADGDDHGR